MTQDQLAKETSTKKFKGTVNKNLVVGTITGLLIAISPYIFYLYEGFPDKPVWETLLFTIESKYYESVNIYVWLILGRFVPLVLLILWFFSCKHWWYHVILIPIAMYTFQLFSVFNNESSYVDEIEIYYLIPIMAVIVPFVYLIRVKLFDKLVHGIDLKAIERELDEYKEKEREEKKKKEEERKKKTF